MSDVKPFPTNNSVQYKFTLVTCDKHPHSEYSVLTRLITCCYMLASSCSKASRRCINLNFTTHFYRRAYSSGHGRAEAEAKGSIEASANDESQSAVPDAPTWSVHTLLSSYPRPRISAELLRKLHDLSALVPPAEGTEEHAKLQTELEEMVRLVEAVKFVDTSRLSDSATSSDTGLQKDDASQIKASHIANIPDGRIWPQGVGMKLSSNTRPVEFDTQVEEGEEYGLELLKHAKVTKNGFYVVEADRRKK